MTTKAQDETEDLGHVYEWFKIYLDPREYHDARERGPGFPPSHEDVRRFYRDYLGRIRSQIERELAGQIGVPWEHARVEFMFSVPTTWTAIGVTNDFERLAKEAGFGKGSPKHSCSISLTEAEAAAVHTFKSGAMTYSVRRNSPEDDHIG